MVIISYTIIDGWHIELHTANLVREIYHLSKPHSCEKENIKSNHLSDSYEYPKTVFSKHVRAPILSIPIEL